MTPEFLAITMLILMIVFVLLGAHIGASLGGLGIIFGYIGWGSGIISMFPDRIFTVCTTFSLEAIILFILMGSALQRSGLAEKLFSTFNLLMGQLRGGLLFGTIILGTLLGACTGIAGASVVAIGMIALPSMLKAGYNKAIASGTICVSGGLGIIIPPSIMLIIYGPQAGLSVATLFTAAIFPGLLLSGLYMLYIGVMCYIKPGTGPALPSEERERYTLNMKLRITVTSLFPTLGLIFAVLGSILFGVASPTEAAAVGAVGSIVLCFAYRQLTWQTAKEILWFTLKTSAFIMLIVVGAQLFTTVFFGLKGAEFTKDLILGLHLGKFGITFIMLFSLFILGGFMDWLPILLVFLPITTPIIEAMQINPLWFAMLFCLALQLSYTTPPFSYSVFFLKGIAPKEVTLLDIYKGVIQFIPLKLIVITLIYVFPEIALWLPSVLG